MRGGAVAARWAHNPKVLGSNPSPATGRKSYIAGQLKNGKPGDLRFIVYRNTFQQKFVIQSETFSRSD
jgi:hypothetical protein